MQTPHPLRQARERDRWTLRGLAERTGIPYSRLWELEHGLRPSPIEARILRAALGVSLGVLLGKPEPDTEAVLQR